MKNFLNMKGMSLVELMVTGSMLAGMALVGTQLNSNMNKSAKGTETKFETVQLTNEIRGYLSSSAACLFTFGAANYSSCTGLIEPTSGACLVSLGAGLIIKDKNGNSIIKFNGTSGDQRGSLVQATDAWITGWNAPALSGTMNLNFRLKNLGFSNKTAIGADSVVRQIPLNISVNGSNQLISCQNVAQGTDNIWANLVDMNGIYYAGGGVIVGTTSDGTIYNGNSMAVGTGNQVTGVNSMAIGINNQVLITGSGLALGHANIADDSRGDGGSVGNVGAVAIGTYSQALSPQSIAIGYGVHSTQRFGSSFGSNSRNHGYGATILGHWNSIGDNALNDIMGHPSFGTAGSGHGINVLGSANGNACGITTHTNTDFLLGYYNAIVGNENHTTNNAIKSIILGNNLRSDARGAMLLGDSSLSLTRDPSDVAPFNVCGQTTTNSIRDSLMSRFNGGYRFYTDKAAVDDRAVYFENNPEAGVNKAWVGINEDTPSSDRIALEILGEAKFKPQTATADASVFVSENRPIDLAFLGVNTSDNTETVPFVLRSIGGAVQLSATKKACNFTGMLWLCSGAELVDPNYGNSQDGLWVVNNPFTAGMFTRGRSWVGINDHTPSDQKYVFEVGGDAKISGVIDGPVSWTSIPINEPSWVACGTLPTPQYKVDALGFVHFRGALKRNQAVDNMDMMPLIVPANGRPTIVAQFAVMQTKNDTGTATVHQCQVRVFPSGFVTTTTTDVMGSGSPNPWQGICCSFDGINYDTN